jgi:hypothetical protein
MPAVFIPKPPFPSVPNLPGVPPIPRSSLLVIAATPAIDAIAAVTLFNAANQAPRWGIFDANNNLVVKADSVMDFDFRKEFRLPSFPIQNGGFSNYDKVNVPFETAVKMTKGGSESDRTNFLNQIEAIAGTLDLYNIVSPEKTYKSCNVTRSENVRRGVANAFFLDVDVFFIEIRQVSAQYSTTTTNTQNAQQPSAQPTSNTGSVQPQPVTPSVMSGINALPNDINPNLSTSQGLFQ